MTTFTLQDLTPQPEEPIQGASGAQYTPVDLKQFYKPLEEIQREQPVSFFAGLEGALRSLIREEVLKALAQREKP